MKKRIIIELENVFITQEKIYIIIQEPSQCTLNKRDEQTLPQLTRFIYTSHPIKH